MKPPKLKGSSNSSELSFNSQSNFNANTSPTKLAKCSSGEKDQVAKSGKV